MPAHATSIIRALPIARLLALKLYNKALKAIAPRREVETRFGARMNCDANDFIQGTITHFGCWEPEVSAALSSIAKPGDTVVDIGANVGYYSLLLSNAVGAKGHVVAIEAHPKFAQAVRNNAALNNVKNIEIINVAVTAMAGEIDLYEAPKSNGGATSTLATRGFATSIKVPGKPLLAILGERAAEVALIKIDIEGAEIPVLTEILDNLAIFSPHLSIEVEADTNPEWPVVFARFVDAGFEAFAMRNDYEWAWYLEGKFGEPKPISALPSKPSDILFRRRLPSIVT